MPINWELAQPRNIFADYAGGLKAGQEMQQENAKRKALNMFTSDPEGAEAALIAAGDFQTAESMRTRREAQRKDKTRKDVGGFVASGDLTGARKVAADAGEFDLVSDIAKMDKEQRELFAQQTSTMASVLYPYKDKSPQEIAADMPTISANLQRHGIDPNKLGLDITEPGVLAQLVSEAMGVEALVAQANSDRDFGLKKDQFGETRRANKAREGIQGGQLAVSRSNSARGWAAHNARQKAGGYGTPGVGGVAVADDDVEIDP